MIFIISLFLIILFHELGHLLISKLCKCPVEIFSIGFGLPLFKFKIKETEYRLSAILLGGYNKLLDELSANNNPNTFPNLKYRYKFFIAIAGCIINIVMGIITWIIGMKIINFNIAYFGIISLWMGILNILPIPAMDGGLIVYLPLFIKKFGQENGLRIYGNISKIFFIILMTTNIIFLPYLIKLILQGKI